MSEHEPPYHLPPIPSNQDPSEDGSPYASRPRSPDVRLPEGAISNGLTRAEYKQLAEQLDVPAYGTHLTERQWRRSHRTAHLINSVFGVIELLLGLRFVLMLVGANPNATFTRFLYAITLPLVLPFLGVFPDPQLHGQSVFELSSLLAILVYAVLNRIIIRFVYLRRTAHEA